MTFILSIIILFWNFTRNTNKNLTIDTSSIFVNLNNITNNFSSINLFRLNIRAAISFWTIWYLTVQKMAAIFKCQGFSLRLILLLLVIFRERKLLSQHKPLPSTEICLSPFYSFTVDSHLKKDRKIKAWKRTHLSFDCIEFKHGGYAGMDIFLEQISIFSNRFLEYIQKCLTPR